MRKLRPLQVSMVAVALAVNVALTGTPAVAASPGTSSGDTGGTVWVGSDTVDVSNLTIVGVIDSTTGEITDVTPYHPEPTTHNGDTAGTPESGWYTTFITHPDCAGRKDFYRLISSKGVQQCFANAGTYELSSGYWTQTQYLCPGNNNGRTKYYAGSANYWSVWRGPESNYDTCYEFNTPVPAFAVQIS